jgi:hypothetical protein
MMECVKDFLDAWNLMGSVDRSATRLLWISLAL